MAEDTDQALAKMKSSVAKMARSFAKFKGVKYLRVVNPDGSLKTQKIKEVKKDE